MTPEEIEELFGPELTPEQQKEVARLEAKFQKMVDEYPELTVEKRIEILQRVIREVLREPPPKN